MDKTSEKFTFGTKAQTLQKLAPLLAKSKILDQEAFSVQEWEQQSLNIMRRLGQKKWTTCPLIVRSSAYSEDNLSQSNAGGYTSILDVLGAEGLKSAVEEVILSYGENASPNDQVLIQPMLKDTDISGVVLTADLDTLAPYYTINYDATGSTDTVTKGCDSKLSTYVHFKQAPLPPEDPKLSALIDACKECEHVTKNTYLDIEFAFDQSGELYLFQVRPIVTQHKQVTRDSASLKTALSKLSKKLNQLSNQHPNLLGNAPIYGIMPDWNPAEIIGVRPRPLALSLYRELITDNIWAFQRDNYGYRNLRSHPLLVSFLGCPFVDVRVSFNSFIPKGLHESIAGKLVDYYLLQLKNTPYHHDKVEFEIVHSCYYLNLPERLDKLREYGFNQNELKRIEFALLDLTNQIIHPDDGLYKKDLRKVEQLPLRTKQLLASDLSEVEKIYWLIEDCKRYGTLPFAGVARAAFVAIQFLRSFVDIGILTRDEYESFLNSLNTVSKHLSLDLNLLQKGELSKESFLERYGHLRPGTYDLLSSRYDENFDHYFSSFSVQSQSDESFEFSQHQMEKINQELVEHGIQTDAQELIQFIREAIEGREYSKFLFTVSLSEVLRKVGSLGSSCGLTLEESSYLNIHTIKELYNVLSPDEFKEILKKDIKNNQKNYQLTEKIKLPNLILKPNDVYSFAIDEGLPNFITLKEVEAEIVSEQQFEKGTEGKIAFIESADPGYDFLFTKKIVGLVTQYGGANSHMAIRCAELGLPAVIGAGHLNFSKWSRSKRIQIDCRAKQVRIVV